MQSLGRSLPVSHTNASLLAVHANGSSNGLSRLPRRSWLLTDANRAFDQWAILAERRGVGQATVLNADP